MTFPKLKTGAASQYPSVRCVRYRTEVLRFLDGSEQRYRLMGKPLRYWRLNFAAVSEEEARRLVNFFELQQGGYGGFAFEDPWEGRTYEDCSMTREEMQTVSEREGRQRTEMELKENRK